ncbi:hypothetical protein SLS58_009256 [Diplodia intermedia]|uniref:C2H2-type domain-containing protein n=1 Tax=Diplodia intermedia TaxID=856260 RepID=A0ABR3TDD5_9PEZI
MVDQLPSVLTAILALSHERLQDTLIYLVFSDKHSRELIEKVLLVPADLSTAEAKVDAPSSTKRKRHEICEQCTEEFDATDNRDEDCTWHDGHLEADYESDFWADWDEYCHGDIATEKNKKAYPQGFYWDCCSAAGDAKGCQAGKHTAAPWTATKRRR